MQVRAGQHISQWRPGRDHRQTESAIPGSGGVLRDLSHELDYLLWMFGPWESVAAYQRPVASLGIDSDALSVILIHFASGTVASVELNYLDQTPRRSIAITTTDGEASLDLISGKYTLDGSNYTVDIDRDFTYREMHTAHLTGSNDSRRCSAEEGDAVLELIRAVENSSNQQKWIRA